MEGIRKGFVTTLYGRDIYLPTDEKEEQLKNKAVNYPIQGGAAEIVKRALPKIAHTDIRLQVHDEFLMNGVYSIPEEMAHIHPDIYTPFDRKIIQMWE